MLKINKIKQVIIAATLLAGVTSCADYLDVSKELAKNLTKEEVFSNVNYIKQWYGECYAALPIYSETGLDNQSNSWNKNPWALMSGELVCAHPNVLKFSQNPYTPLNSESHKWLNAYQRIRQIMIFLQMAPESLGSANDNGYISSEEMTRYKADVTYLMAYYYFSLFELYGPTPIVTDLADPGQAHIDYERATVDEMVAHIDGLLLQLIDGPYKNVLPKTLRENGMDGGYDLTNILRPTQAAVLALRARMYTYAASPLFNGGYTEALDDKYARQSDGKRIFPNYDANKWKLAKQRLEELLAFADANGFKLYVDPSATPDPNASVYKLFQEYNDEILWATGNNDYNSVSSSMEARTIPGDISGGMGNVGMYQNFIDLFFTENGLDINDDPAYSEDGFTDYDNRCTTITSKTKVLHKDKHIFNMYTKREPRFYAAVTFEGKSWHIQKDETAKHKDFGAYFSKGGKAFKDNTMHARTGYLLYKFNNRSCINYGSNIKKWGRPWIYFRLADFYLLYAEVCNEIDPTDNNVVKYLDMIRDRAGIPGYAALAAAGKTNIIGNQELQREAIQRERAIELFAEGNYYFDTRRWMTAGYGVDYGNQSKGYQKNNDDKMICRYGMNINIAAVESFNSDGIPTKFKDAIGEGSYYNRIVVDKYPWVKAMLFYPIPYNEFQKSRLLIQNPLW